MSARLAAGAVAALLLGAGCSMAGEAGPSASGSSAGAARTRAPAAAEPADLPAPDALRSRVETTAEPRQDGLVDWRADWVLEWDDVPGADGYVAQLSTSEGGGRDRALTGALLRIDAAAGTSPPERVEQDASAQLAFSRSQLVVRVAATGDGGAGAPSGWVPVGEVTPAR